MIIANSSSELLSQVAALPPNAIPHPTPDRLPEALVVAHHHSTLHPKELALAATMEAMKSYAKNMHYDAHDANAMERFMGEAMFHAEMLREEKGAQIVSPAMIRRRKLFLSLYYWWLRVVWG